MAVVVLLGPGDLMQCFNAVVEPGDGQWEHPITHNLSRHLR